MRAYSLSYLIASRLTPVQAIAVEDIPTRGCWWMHCIWPGPAARWLRLVAFWSPAPQWPLASHP